MSLKDLYCILLESLDIFIIIIIFSLKDYSLLSAIIDLKQELKVLCPVLWRRLNEINLSYYTCHFLLHLLHFVTLVLLFSDELNSLYMEVCFLKILLTSSDWSWCLKSNNYEKVTYLSLLWKIVIIPSP